MKRFELRPPGKRSPLPARRRESGAEAAVTSTKAASDVGARDGLHTDLFLADNMSDCTDSEPGVRDVILVDQADGRSVTPDPTYRRTTIEGLKSKITKTKENIEVAQNDKQELVKSYLELTNRTENEETIRNIKQHFEKKNQASANQISKLQKKLERYNRELKSAELNTGTTLSLKTGGHLGAREVKDHVIQGIKGIGGSVVENFKTATDALVPKARSDPAKSKSGSADHLNNLSTREGHSTFYTGFLETRQPLSNGHICSQDGGGSHDSPMRAGSDPTSPSCSTTLPANFKLSVPIGGSEAEGPVNDGSGASDSSYQRESPHNSSLSADQPLINGADSSLSDRHLAQLTNISHNMSQFAHSLESMRGEMSELHEEMAALRLQIEEDRSNDKYDRLEEHINDFVELTQNELTNLKQEISNMEEKIDYQLDERTRDLQEALENANTRISKMELHNQHQQLINMEGVENANAKVLLTKFINVILAFLAVILVFVSTISTILGPFLNSRWKVISMAIIIGGLILVSSNWESISPHIEQTINRIQSREGHPET